jgi:hypothetical protein
MLEMIEIMKIRETKVLLRKIFTAVSKDDVTSHYEYYF